MTFDECMSLVSREFPNWRQFLSISPFTSGLPFSDKDDKFGSQVDSASIEVHEAIWLSERKRYRRLGRVSLCWLSGKGIDSMLFAVKTRRCKLLTYHHDCIPENNGSYRWHTLGTPSETHRCGPNPRKDCYRDWGIVMNVPVDYVQLWDTWDGYSLLLGLVSAE